MEARIPSSEHVQCWISNIAFPTSPEELLMILNTGDGWYDTEIIAHERTGIKWTVPRWARRGDIMFFLHSTGAISKIRVLSTRIEQERARFSESDYTRMTEAIERGKDIHKRIGGRIFAAARVASPPSREITDPIHHWRSSVYATIADTRAFPVPLHTHDLKDGVSLCRTGAVTPLYDTQFDLVRTLLARENKLPGYITECEADPFAFGRVTMENWLTVGKKLRARITLEDQFRACYVNYLLRSLSAGVYRECRCKKAGIPDSFVDYVVRIGGKYLPVEVKLRAELSVIREQLWKYCFDESIELNDHGKTIGPKQIWSGQALLIDVDAVRLYDGTRDTFSTVYYLDDLDEYTLGDLEGTLLYLLNDTK